MAASATQQMSHQPVREISGRPGGPGVFFSFPLAVRLRCALQGTCSKCKIASTSGSWPLLVML